MPQSVLPGCVSVEEEVLNPAGTKYSKLEWYPMGWANGQRTCKSRTSKRGEKHVVLKMENEL